MIAARLAQLPLGANQHHRIEGTPNGVPSRAEVKQMLNVSEGSMHRAKVIERDGIPDKVRRPARCAGLRLPGLD